MTVTTSTPAESARISRRTFSRLLATSTGLTTAALTGLPGMTSPAWAADGDNLLPNGGFEQLGADGLPTDWTRVGTVVSVTDVVKEGARAVRLDDLSATAGAYVRSSKVPTEPAIVYVASAQVLRSVDGAFLYLEFWDETDTRIAVRQTPADLSRTDWQEITATGSAPDNATHVTVLCYCSNADIGPVWFDDVRLTRPPAEEVREFALATPGHPRLYFTEDDLPGLRARTTDQRPNPWGTPVAEVWSRVLAEANVAVAETEFTQAYIAGVSIVYPLPPVQPEPHDPPPGYTAGPYPYWTAMAEGIRRRLQSMSLAYAITSDPRFAVRIREYLLSLAEWDTWSDPAHLTYTKTRTELDTAALTIGASFAFDVIHDFLDETERVTVRTSIASQALEKLHLDLTSPAPDNHWMLRTSALAIGASVLHGTDERTHAWLTRATNVFDWYLGLFQTGGQEGYSYTGYAVDNIIEAAGHVSRVTGDAGVLGNPYLDQRNAEGKINLMRWILRGLIPGGTSLAPISDSESTTYFGITAAVLASDLGDGHAGWYLQQAKPSTPAMQQFIYGGTDIPVTPPTDLPTSTVLDGVGWASIRSGWEADDQLFILVANDSRLGHNHFDQNSFVLGTNGSWIAADPGYRSYIAGPKNDYTVDLGHSTVYVDGTGQGVTVGFPQGRGSMRAGVMSEACTFVVGSAAKAYGKKPLDRFDRHVVSLPEHYHLIWDVLAAPDAHVYDWRLAAGTGTSFSLDGTAFELGSSRIGRVVEQWNDAAQLRATFLDEADRTISVAAPAGAEEYGSQIKVSSGDPSREAEFLTLIQAGPRITPGLFQAETLPVATSGVGLRNLSIGGATVTFLRSSAAGHWVEFIVTLATAATYDLRAWFGSSPSYGQIQVAVDQIELGPIHDAYDPEITISDAVEFGTRTLEAGEHTVRLTVVDKNAASAGYFISVDAFQFVEVGTEVEAQPLPALDPTRVTGVNAHGVTVLRSSAEAAITDIIGLSASSGTAELAGVTAEAAQFQVSISHGAEGAEPEIERFAASGARSLNSPARRLLSCARALDIGVIHDPAGGVARATVSTEVSQSVTFHSRYGAAVEVDGVPTTRFRYDTRAALLTIHLTAGDHQLIIR